jgi:CDGSH-type Zn-finger protein/uncharacterized Fe-S cluster protein YjdI
MTTQTYRGKAVDVTFDGSKCIHSRYCVLTLPQVFRANVPGDWIAPDAAAAEEIAALARFCPSGAITYHRKDSAADEAAPEVNAVRVWENGPYAFHADVRIKGEPVGYRATLCRCGASKNKPYCDGSHNDAGFAATGELPAKDASQLSARNGVVNIRPTKNGPLIVEGNLEICRASGRVVARVTKTALCRCGGSADKPYCDGTHAKNGFLADD